MSQDDFYFVEPPETPWSQRWFWAGLAIVFTTILLFSCVGPSPVHASSFKEVVDNSYQLFDGTRPICSTTYIGSDTKGEGAFFLSAAHCLGGKGGLNIRIQNMDDEFNLLSEEIHYLEPVRTFKENDVTLLKVKSDLVLGKGVDIATIEEIKTHVSIGIPVISLGFPKTFEKTVTEGVYTGMANTKQIGTDIKPLQRATTQVQPGSSGGGLFVKIDDEYKLFGVTTAYWPDAPYMSYFSTIESIDKLVKFFIRK